MKQRGTRKLRPDHHEGSVNPKMNTFHGVQHWFVSVYEEFGWMVLMKAKHYDYKVLTYKKSLDKLMKAIEHLKTEYKDHDRLHDLHVLWVETKLLCDFAKKHL